MKLNSISEAKIIFLILIKSVIIITITGSGITYLAFQHYFERVENTIISKIINVSEL